MLSDTAISFDRVSKIYSKGSSAHGTLRDDILSLFNRRKKTSLKENEFYALKDLSFDIKKGQSIGLYGPNGSGKSTLLKLIANVISPSSGCVKVNGRIAPLIELGAGFHPDLTGIENIYMNGAILGMTIGEIKSKLERIVEYSGLAEFISTPVKKYSSGMKLRLGFSVAVHSEADIFLFDEVLAVGDEDFRIKSFYSIIDLLKKRKTLIVVSHNKDKLTQIAKRMIYIEKGKVV
nr:ABC transporter ATP-binding protein [uncultured Desulfobacter sp.]